MLLRRSTVLAPGTMLLLTQQSFCQSKNTDKSQDVDHKLLTLVRNILEGQNLEEAKTQIDPAAYVIVDTNFVSLIGAINGEFKDCKVIEGKGTRIDYEHLTLTPDQTSAYMTLLTYSADKTKHYHSIIFFKSYDDQWKIVSWHISK